MCGIFGYVGKKISLSELINGLTRLEYRGYDSCGFAAAFGNSMAVKKQPGKISQLIRKLGGRINKKTSLCILHTRWATHGAPSKRNAHPHLDCSRSIALVHNGIIENHQSLQKELVKEGHRLLSDTDTEVIIHLIEKLYHGNLEDAVLRAARQLKGAYAFAVICKDEPRKLVAARRGSPLIIGLAKSGYFIASDTLAVLPFTRDVAYLGDDEVAVLYEGGIKAFNLSKAPIRLKKEKILIKSRDAEKGRFAHFMLKEIFEQPAVLRKTFALYCKGKIKFPDINLKANFFKKIKKIHIAACGTAYHAGLAAKYFLEDVCGIDVEVDVSSEFRYRRKRYPKGTLVIAVSQSGETADTLAAVRRAKKDGAKILGICNMLGSSLTKESDGLIYTPAGLEIGVASTKAYTAQTAALFLFGLFMVNLRYPEKAKWVKNILREFRKIPFYQEAVLKEHSTILKVAKRFSSFGSFLFLGRGINYPSALEGALKLKEISYIPAEGYPAGEMKHGPIALIDEYRAVVCIAPQDELYEKTVSNIQEIKARKGKVLGILNYNDSQAALLSDAVIYVPKLKKSILNPLLFAVPLQLFAYYVAKNLGCEIDQPRNLAKSVTVE